MSEVAVDASLTFVMHPPVCPTCIRLAFAGQIGSGTRDKNGFWHSTCECGEKETCMLAFDPHHRCGPDRPGAGGDCGERDSEEDIPL